MLYNPAVETLPLNTLRELQNQRLKQLVQRVYVDVPFYKKRLDDARIRPEDITSVSDLSVLPFTHKSDLRDNYPYDLFAVPMQAIRRIHASSGTTGKPTVVGYTKNDLELFDEVTARSLVCAGARPGMILQNAYGYGLFTGGLGMHGGATKLGLAVIPVSGGMTERQLTILQDFKPDILCCTPSYAQTLARSCAEKGIDTSTLSLQFAVLGAEPWTESMRSHIEKELNIKATNIYGLSEIIGPGVSQEDVDERGSGSYIWEDHFYPEVVDRDTGAVLPYGQEGVLVFTTLTKEAFPLIRYWTNDICSINYDPNGKRTHIKMSAIKGRADDMLIIRGVNVFHTQVEEIISDFNELIPAYRLIVSRHDLMDSVYVEVEVRRGLDAHQSDLADRLAISIKEHIGVRMQVELKPYGSLPRSEGGKINRIIDRRQLS